MLWSRLISTIDTHAGGEPLRIITSGLPPLLGSTVLDRRADLQLHHDDLRRLLLFEPRGHADMYGAIITPPNSSEADYGVIFLTNEGYSTMCGHGIIALTTALLETGTFPITEPETTIRYDTPAGRVVGRAAVDDGRVRQVAFANVPAYQLVGDIPINAGGGEIVASVAWGGAFYALVEAEDLAMSIEPSNGSRLIELGMAVKRAVSARVDVRHPGDPRLSGLYGTIISGPPQAPSAHGRNATIYADGAIDRSPCGTGTSAKLAMLYARGDVDVGQPYVHESIIGTTFEGRITGKTTVGDTPAIQTDITGRGFVTGFHQFVLDRDDPLPKGFLKASSSGNWHLRMVPDRWGGSNSENTYPGTMCPHMTSRCFQKESDSWPMVFRER